MKICCIIVEDEPLAQKLLEDNIRVIPFLEWKGTFSNTVDAAIFLSKNKIDLLFLDIRLPGKSGMEFSKQLEKEYMVIFTTAYDQYALEGFEVNAIDYLLKPIGSDRFLQACEKAREYAGLRALAEKDSTCLFIRSEHATIKMETKNILYIEGLKDYVKIFIEGNNKAILTRMNLKGIESLLPDKIFCRVHKSFIVNLRRVKEYGKDYVEIPEKEIPLGESYRDQFKEKYLTAH